MALGKLVTFLTLTTMASTQYNPSSYNPSSYQPLPSKVLQVPEYIADSSKTPPELSLTLQIPRDEAPIPFDTYAPSSDLRAPEAFETPTDNFYEVAVPSQDLQVPSAERWNPDNDPALYYELPVEITKETVPTDLHPKKYNKQVFDKVKPVSSKPKEELYLVPVREQELNVRRKQQEKAIVSYGKVENQKQVKAEKVKEPAVAASGFGASSFDSSPSSSSSLGSGQRVEFQMHGHAGPKTYKWGYDTGKGHNRQFRFEERDKEGNVKGHYGFFDKHGKLQMVHYDAHPHEGFHAEGNFGKF